MMSIGRWNALMRALGATPDADTFNRLTSAYAERHRAYHTARHIGECLSLLDDWKHLASHPAEVECALWFHDAIYEPLSSSNEERSADWAREFAIRVGVQHETADRIHSHVMATRHLSLSTDLDSALTVDIDLAILGADPQRYSEFERDVRQEYRWVPEFMYRSKRASILKSFLDRPRIYSSALAFERFEQIARNNLAESIQYLEK